MGIQVGVGLLVVLAVVNLAAIGWLLLRSGSRSHGADERAIATAGRFDAIERHGEALRRTLTDMDQGLRGEIAKSTRDGFAAAFDKV
ncbi:MAG: hypothetical protein JO008_02710, partial [Alphaproteobacteria bacterium]|nr:hypothetical protein [Alphaproteobacteria bacterium]